MHSDTTCTLTPPASLRAALDAQMQLSTAVGSARAGWYRRNGKAREMQQQRDGTTGRRNDRGTQQIMPLAGSLRTGHARYCTRHRRSAGDFSTCAPKACGPGRLSKVSRHGLHGTHGRYGYVSQLAGNSVAKAQAQPLPHAPQSHACRGVMIPLECARPQEWMRAYSPASLAVCDHAACIAACRPGVRQARTAQT